MDPITELTKSIKRAEIASEEALRKSHVKGYTRQDGTAVQEHDDSRQSKLRGEAATEHANDMSTKAERSGKPEDHQSAAEAHRHAAKHGEPGDRSFHRDSVTEHEEKADQPVKQFKKGDKVKDNYGKDHEVLEQRGNSVKTYQSGANYIHASKLRHKD